MKSISYNDRNYTCFWAWLPIRSTKGSLLWMQHYYIRPGHNGEGLVLSHQDMLLDNN